MSRGRIASWCSQHRKPLILSVLTLVAYIGAVSRAQPLPWVLAALLTATLVVGYVWPHWLLKRLAVTRSGPAYADEGQTITFQVEIHNRGWLPRFMVELVDRLPFITAALNDPNYELVGTPLGVVAYLPARNASRFDVPVVCEKRGYYRLGPISMASTFPLGLAEARQGRNDGVQSLTIYPDVFTILSLPLMGAPSQMHRGGYLLPQGAGAAEFSGLREYRRGDNPRHIHWPSSAKHNELIVKEYEPLASACLCIAIDQSRQSNVGLGKHATFEYAVRIAASIARFACLQNLQIRIVGAALPSLQPYSSSGDMHYQQILNDLAVIDCNEPQRYAALLNEIAIDNQPGDTIVVFMSEDEFRSNETLRAIGLLQSKQAHILAIVFDQSSFPVEIDEIDKIVAGSNKYSASSSQLAGTLQDMGAQVMMIRCGDDLVCRFNP